MSDSISSDITIAARKPVSRVLCVMSWTSSIVRFSAAMRRFISKIRLKTVVQLRPGTTVNHRCSLCYSSALAAPRYAARLQLLTASRISRVQSLSYCCRCVLVDAVEFVSCFCLRDNLQFSTSCREVKHVDVNRIRCLS